MIPRDSAIERAIRQQFPVSILNPQAKSSKAFESLAVRLVNNEVEQPEERTGIAYLLSNVILRKA